ncbi:MAG: nicotinate-nicotinamide nucleotide adenylyltransferase [Bryobacteraceae bacterium]|nr:nicotinate-nicotinamide nucleotide adenylyltransferase [Bryobacteraceae bacterium]MDW8376907.1 nicotinate-nicotinamide nucleotide adenylyltransferase [Bryobacterales bacterium]
MRFIRKAIGAPARLGILAGAFHPPTQAHLALARTALDLFETDEVLFVLPARFPHKKYENVGLDERLSLLLDATSGEPRFSVALSDGGLFYEIAREARPHYPEAARLRFLCGRDAAERIVKWPYEGLPSIEQQLKEFDLLVAKRKGEYLPPPGLEASIHPLRMEGDWESVSSTEVRRRIAAGEPWEELVPEAIREPVRKLYGSLSLSPAPEPKG